MHLMAVDQAASDQSMQASLVELPQSKKRKTMSPADGLTLIRGDNVMLSDKMVCSDLSFSCAGQSVNGSAQLLRVFPTSVCPMLSGGSTSRVKHLVHWDSQKTMKGGSLKASLYIAPSFPAF